jgi:hypothetical protein
MMNRGWDCIVRLENSEGWRGCHHSEGRRDAQNYFVKHGGGEN